MLQGVDAPHDVVCLLRAQRQAGSDTLRCVGGHSDMATALGVLPCGMNGSLPQRAAHARDSVPECRSNLFQRITDGRTWP